MSVVNVKVTRDETAWEAVVAAEIPVESLEKYRTETLTELQKGAHIDGFRPGKAPVERIVQMYGEDMLMRRAAEHAIQHELPEILAKENVLIIESPRVTTDTPERGKSLTFTARAALAPKIELADYAEIAKKHNAAKEDTSVTDEEHAQALTHLKRERARIDKIESGAEPEKAAEESRAMEEKDLPELDDQFTKTLGYENAALFSEALRTNIKNEKELRAAEKRRQLILDDLVAQSKVSYPQRLREYELEEMEARLKDDLSRMSAQGGSALGGGNAFETYLKQVGKTREELRESWMEVADKRAKVRLILAEIARKEDIEPDQAALSQEIEHARKHYPQTDLDALRAHISHAMRNEQTLKFLENIS